MDDSVAFLLNDQRLARANAVLDLEGDPEQAARAMQISQSTGADPNVVLGDLDGWERNTKSALATGIIDNNEHLRNWLGTTPLASKIASDDYANLDTVSEKLGRFGFISQTKKIAEAFSEGVGEGPVGAWVDRSSPEFAKRYPYSAFLYKALGSPIEVPARLFMGAASAVSTLAAEGVTAVTGSEAWGGRMARDVTAGLQANLTGNLLFRGMIAPEFQQLARKVAPYLKEGKPIPAGVDLAVDQAKLQQTQVDLADLNEGVAAAQASAVRERSPEMFAEFVRQQVGNDKIGVPADAILELYGGKVPAPDDGVLGWVPRLTEQLEVAKETGGDVEVPLADYLARVDPQVHKALEPSLRTRPEGITLVEGELRAAEDYKLTPIVDETPTDVVGQVVRDTREVLKPDMVFDAGKPFGTKPEWMSIDQYTRYLAGIAKRQAEDAAWLQKRAEKAARERLTPEWKEHEVVMRQEVAEDIAASPQFQADEFFREGRFAGQDLPQKFRIGEEFLNEEQRAALPPSFISKAGIDPNAVAGLLGYGSGDELVFALAELHRERVASGKNAPAFRRAVIDAEVERRMEEKYGAFSKNVLEEAKEQVLSETQVDLLHEDTLALGLKAGAQFPITKDQFQAWAKGKFAETLVESVDSDKFLRDAGKAGRLVEDALLKGDIAEAFRQRQRQYLAVTLAKEAVAFEKEVAKVDKFAKRYSARELKGVEQEYVDFAQMLLRQAGYKSKNTLDEIGQSISFHGNTTLEAFVQKAAGEGWQPEIADWLQAQGAKPAEAMSTAEFREFKDALDSLNHIGREVKKILVAGEKADWEAWRQTVLDHVTQLPIRSRESQGRWLFEADASITRMEEMIKDLDLRKELGPLYRAVIEPMMLSKAKEFDLLTELGKHFKETRGKFGREWKKSLSDTIPQDFLIDPYTNTPYDLSRENLIQIMLNWGNRSNIEKFTRGYASLKLGRLATKEEAAAFETSVKALIDQHATKEDWEFVQRMWEPFRKWQPMTDVVSRNVSGVSPKWITPEKVTTPHGEYEGGYWPVKYDRLGSNLAVIEDRKDSNALFGPNYFRAATAKSHLKERTGYVDFVDINTSIEQAAGVMQQTIHDIAYRDALVQANRVFNDKSIRGAIRKHYGSEYEAQLMPWLKRIANQYSADERAVKWYNDWQRRVRVNTIGHVLPLNLKVILSPDIGVPNPKAWAGYVANRSDNVKLAMEKSNEIRHLVYNMDRDFREQLELAHKDAKFESLQLKAVEWGFTPMMKFSQEFRMATFVDQYQKAKGRGLSDHDAATVADSYVRERHGAASVVDLPAVMQSSETMKSLTMFYSYFNSMYNWQRQIPGNIRRREWGEASVNALGSVVVGAAFGALLFNQAHEGDSWFKTIGKAMLLQPLSTIPIVRDASNIWLEGNPARTPTVSVFQAMSSLYTDVKRAAQGKQMKNPVKNTANVIGYSTGLPLAQVGRTGEFLNDVRTRQQRPRNFQEWWRGVVTGEARLKKSRD